MGTALVKAVMDDDPNVKITEAMIDAGASIIKREFYADPADEEDERAARDAAKGIFIAMLGAAKDSDTAALRMGRLRAALERVLIYHNDMEDIPDSHIEAMIEARKAGSALFDKRLDDLSEYIEDIMHIKNWRDTVA